MIYRYCISGFVWATCTAISESPIILTHAEIDLGRDYLGCEYVSVIKMREADHIVKQRL